MHRPGVSILANTAVRKKEIRRRIFGENTAAGSARTTERRDFGQRKKLANILLAST